MTAAVYALQLLSTAALGLFAGAMLTEGLLLVPWWRSLAPGEFLSWYAANGSRLQDYFGPLTWLAGLLALGGAFASIWSGHPGRWAAAVAAALMLLAVSSFFVYFGRANASFAAGAVRAADLPAELARWAAWHWVRTGLSLGALASALLSLRRVG